MKGITSARVVLITVLGGLLLSVAAFAPVYAGSNDGTAGNKNQGCNQQKETPEHHYDADCDGSASENGGGNGGGGEGGGGKPCAGCVGKADNKHPPGQEPDENDNNKGYECDDNKGVGAQRGTGNPAHTGCRPPSQTTTPPPTTTPPTTTTPPPTTTPPTTTTPPGSVPPSVLPTIIENCDANPEMPGVQPCEVDEVCDANEEMPGTQVCGDIIGGEDEEKTAAERAKGETLPYTGAAIIAFVIAGIGLILGGLVAVRRTKQ